MGGKTGQGDRHSWLHSSLVCHDPWNDRKFAPELAPFLDFLPPRTNNTAPSAHPESREASSIMISLGCFVRRTSQVALVVKKLPLDVEDLRDAGLTPGLGISPGGVHGNPLQYCCLEKSMEEEPDGLKSIELQTVRHNWACTHTQLFRKPTPYPQMRPWLLYFVPSSGEWCQVLDSLYSSSTKLPSSPHRGHTNPLKPRITINSGIVRGNWGIWAELAPESSWGGLSSLSLCAVSTCLSSFHTWPTPTKK